MKINYDNYESFIIDYVEGNLSDADREELFSFFELHPHLINDLKLYQQTILIPEEQILFPNKEKLRKNLSKKSSPVIRQMIYWSAAAAIITGIFLVNYFKVDEQKPIAVIESLQNESQEVKQNILKKHIEPTEVKKQIKMTSPKIVKVERKVEAEPIPIKQESHDELLPIQPLVIAQLNTTFEKDLKQKVIENNEQTVLIPTTIIKETNADNFHQTKKISWQKMAEKTVAMIDKVVKPKISFSKKQKDNRTILAFSYESKNLKIYKK